MKPAYGDNFSTAYSVDALTGLNTLPEKSVHMAVTSPPYWGLRSYLPSDHPDKPQELGAEPTPELYVERLVEVFRALRTALRNDGTLWLNLGDSYWGGGGGNYGSGKSIKGREGVHPTNVKNRSNPSPLKPKDLVGIPWMVAFALRADGWYLRSDIIWSKPNPMPESVTDRLTKSHEYIFLLTKSARYFFDAEAIKEDSVRPGDVGVFGSQKGASLVISEDDPQFRGGHDTWGKEHTTASTRNKRSVWTVATKPFSGSHYACFPSDLIYPCIKAGTSERGVCEACLAPWVRVVEQARGFTDGRCNGCGESRSKHQQGDKSSMRTQEWGKTSASTTMLGDGAVPCGSSRTVGWQPSCSCNADTMPATVLDPFMGSGTTAYAARKLGRRSVGFDLDERNIQLIEERLGYQEILC